MLFTETDCGAPKTYCTAAEISSTFRQRLLINRLSSAGISVPELLNISVLTNPGLIL